MHSLVIEKTARNAQRRFVLFILLLVFAFGFPVGCALSEQTSSDYNGHGAVAIVTVYAKEGTLLRRYRADVRDEDVVFSDNICMFPNADTHQPVTINTDQCTVVIDYLPVGVDPEL